MGATSAGRAGRPGGLRALTVAAAAGLLALAAAAVAGLLAVLATPAAAAGGGPPAAPAPPPATAPAAVAVGGAAVDGAAAGVNGAQAEQELDAVPLSLDGDPVRAGSVVLPWLVGVLLVAVVAGAVRAYSHSPQREALLAARAAGAGAGASDRGDEPAGGPPEGRLVSSRSAPGAARTGA